MGRPKIIDPETSGEADFRETGSFLLQREEGTTSLLTFHALPP
jgi:hypothetical protein